MQTVGEGGGTGDASAGGRRLTRPDRLPSGALPHHSAFHRLTNNLHLVGFETYTCPTIISDSGEQWLSCVSMVTRSV